MGLLYFWSRSIQEMGGNVVIGRSISGVVGVVILPILRYIWICIWIYMFKSNTVLSQYVL